MLKNDRRDRDFLDYKVGRAEQVRAENIVDTLSLHGLIYLESITRSFKSRAEECPQLIPQSQKLFP